MIPQHQGFRGSTIEMSIRANSRRVRREAGQGPSSAAARVLALPWGRGQRGTGWALGTDSATESAADSAADSGGAGSSSGVADSGAGGEARVAGRGRSNRSSAK